MGHSQEVENLRAKLAVEEANAPQTTTGEEPAPRVAAAAAALLEPPFEPATLIATAGGSATQVATTPPQSLPQLSPFEEWKRAKMVFSYGGGDPRLR